MKNSVRIIHDACLILNIKPVDTLKELIFLIKGRSDQKAIEILQFINA